MNRERMFILWTLAALVTFAPAACGRELRKASPKSVGLSQERLDRITAMMHKHVDEGLLAGAVALVARDGKIAYLQGVGMRDREQRIKMSEDTIFRIASMTKPVTSVAVMMLYEEGHFQLKDPISKYIPEFRAVKVLASGDGSQESAVTARRPITIHHLLTHTSGLTYHWDSRVGARYREAGITHGLLQDDNLLGDDMKKLAQMPLVHQPGEGWTYGLSIDVLGRLVEVVSGMSLDEFFRTRIFEPLRMKDTCFYLPKDKTGRLAAVYGPDPNGTLKRLADGILGAEPFVCTTTYPCEGPRKYYSGGGGLCSTISDYARFAQMLLNGGELDGVRLLSPKTVELMTADHVGDLNRESGFGLGFGVTRSLRESAELTSVGAYRWGGFWYTTFFIDPAEKMFGICMAQLYPAGNATLNASFEALAHQAIVDPN